MEEINIKVRVGTEVLYNRKLTVDLHLTVLNFKKNICLLDKTLVCSGIVVVFRGSILEDDTALYIYGISKGATVHIFKEHKPEKKVDPKVFSESDIVKLGATLRSFTINPSYRAALTKLSKPEMINTIIVSTPGLSEDPVAITLLQHSELLSKLNDLDSVKRIADNHPALALAALKIASAVHEEVSQNHFTADMARSVALNGSDEDMEDVDDSSPASDASSQPVPRNLSFAAITAAQLASAIASVTTQQPQPSTSGASTSTASLGNVNTMEPFSETLLRRQPGDFDVQLQMMRDMGLVNDALNLEALQLSGDFGAAVDLVLNGFSTDNE